MEEIGLKGDTLSPYLNIKSIIGVEHSDCEFFYCLPQDSIIYKNNEKLYIENLLSLTGPEMMIDPNEIEETICDFKVCRSMKFLVTVCHVKSENEDKDLPLEDRTKISVYETKNYSMIKVMRLQRTGVIRSVEFTYDGSYIIVLASYSENAIFVWEWKKSDKVLSLSIMSNEIYKIKWTYDSNMFLSCGDDGVVKLWAIEETFTGVKILNKRAYKGISHAEKVIDCILIDSNKLLVGTDSGELVILEEGKIIFNMGEFLSMYLNQSQFWSIYSILSDSINKDLIIIAFSNGNIVWWKLSELALITKGLQNQYKNIGIKPVRCLFISNCKISSISQNSDTGCIVIASHSTGRMFKVSIENEVELVKVFHKDSLIELFVEEENSPSFLVLSKEGLIMRHNTKHFFGSQLLLNDNDKILCATSLECKSTGKTYFYLGCQSGIILVYEYDVKDSKFLPISELKISLTPINQIKLNKPGNYLLLLAGESSILIINCMKSCSEKERHNLGFYYDIIGSVETTFKCFWIDWSPNDEYILAAGSKESIVAYVVSDLLTKVSNLKFHNRVLHCVNHLDLLLKELPTKKSIGNIYLASFFNDGTLLFSGDERTLGILFKLTYKLEMCLDEIQMLNINHSKNYETKITSIRAVIDKHLVLVGTNLGELVIVNNKNFTTILRVDLFKKFSNQSVKCVFSFDKLIVYSKSGTIVVCELKWGLESDNRKTKLYNLESQEHQNINLKAVEKIEQQSICPAIDKVNKSLKDRTEVTKDDIQEESNNPHLKNFMDRSDEVSSVERASTELSNIQEKIPSFRKAELLEDCRNKIQNLKENFLQIRDRLKIYGWKKFSVVGIPPIFIPSVSHLSNLSLVNDYTRRKTKDGYNNESTKDLIEKKNSTTFYKRIIKFQDASRVNYNDYNKDTLLIPKYDCKDKNSEVNIADNFGSYGPEIAEGEQGEVRIQKLNNITQSEFNGYLERLQRYEIDLRKLESLVKFCKDEACFSSSLSNGSHEFDVINVPYNTIISINNGRSLSLIKKGRFTKLIEEELELLINFSKPGNQQYNQKNLLENDLSIEQEFINIRPSLEVKNLIKYFNYELKELGYDRFHLDLRLSLSRVNFLNSKVEGVNRGEQENKSGYIDELLLAKNETELKTLKLISISNCLTYAANIEKEGLECEFYNVCYTNVRHMIKRISEMQMKILKADYKEKILREERKNALKTIFELKKELKTLKLNYCKLKFMHDSSIYEVSSWEQANFHEKHQFSKAPNAKSREKKKFEISLHEKKKKYLTLLRENTNLKEQLCKKKQGISNQSLILD